MLPLLSIAQLYPAPRAVVQPGFKRVQVQAPQSLTALPGAVNSAALLAYKVFSAVADHAKVWSVTKLVNKPPTVEQSALYLTAKALDAEAALFLQQ